MKVFNGIQASELIELIFNEFNLLWTGKYQPKRLVITKSVGNIDEYKVRELSEDSKKRTKRLKELNCTEEEYREKALPAQAQLALRMGRRGIPVQPGSRLEYVITTTGGVEGRSAEMIEDITYFLDHREVLRINYLEYIRLAINPFDEIFEKIFNMKKVVFNHYKLKLKKHYLLENLKTIFSPKIEFV